jgi:hypothetical protein
MGRPGKGTVRLQVRVSKEVADFLTMKARKAGMPLTELGGALLEYAAEAEAKEEGEALVMPTVRQVVRQELSLFLERTLDLQIRTYLEAGTARRMVQANMHYGHWISVEEIKEIEAAQWKVAWKASRQHLDGLQEWKQMMTDSADVRGRKEERVGDPAENDHAEGSTRLLASLCLTTKEAGINREGEAPHEAPGRHPFYTRRMAGRTYPALGADQPETAVGSSHLPRGFAPL